MTIEEFEDLFILSVKRSVNADSLAEIALLLERSVQKNFDQEGRYGKLEDEVWLGGETRWQKLSATTLRARTKKGYYPGKILQNTGALKTSVLITANSEVINMSAQTEYASHLHYGTKRMPARPFLVVQEEDLDSMADVLALELDSRL